MNKYIAIMAILLICLECAGSSYAFQTNNKASFKFLMVTSSDNETETNIGLCIVGLEDGNNDGLNEGLIITIENSYAGYEAYVNFTLKNMSSDNIGVISLEIKNPNPQALSLDIIGLDSVTMFPEETADFTVTITILPYSQQNQNYSFEMTMILAGS